MLDRWSDFELIKEGAVIYGCPCKPCLLCVRMDHHHPHLPNLRRAYKSILKKCLLNFKSSSKSKLLRPPDAAASSDPSPPSLQDPLPSDTRRSKSLNGVRSFGYSNSDPKAPSTFRKHPSFHQAFPLSKNATQRNQANQPSSVSRSPSQKNIQSMSSPATSTPIKFSKSSGIIKPPPVEKKLECSLEELCFGSMKKIIITRDVLTNNGQTVQEEELRTIKVKPGWRKGTKITFEGMGNERPGSSEAADVIFEIAEKKHALFRRQGDDLEFAVKIPLVKALTGCTISVPLLDGNKLSLTMNEIIWPGHEHIVVGQGMPTSKEHGTRGNLKITFLVEFPIKLSDKQRSDIIPILQDSS